MYKLLDVFLLVFHLVLVVFVLFGWIWRKTRPWNLAIILLTLASWFILGLFYGIGYCPLTDWHWQVLRKLGETGMPPSYISYLVQRFTGFTPAQDLIDALTLLGALAALAASLTLSIRDYKKSPKPKGKI